MLTVASSSKRVIYAALAGNSLISMLSEGIHSIVDTGAMTRWHGWVVWIIPWSGLTR